MDIVTAVSQNLYTPYASPFYYDIFCKASLAVAVAVYLCNLY